MSIVGPTQVEIDRAIHGSSEESNTGAIFQHPRAPKILSKELPDIDESTQQHPMTINYGNDQWIPPNLLFHNDIRPGIDSRLGYINKTRAIAQPSFTCIANNTWGAVTPHIVTITAGENETRQVSFEESFDAATQPPLPRMVIGTDTGHVIIADAAEGRSFVTVLDVQRAVIHWMKDTQTNLGMNNKLTRQFSKPVRMIDDDGIEVELEVWVWKGLSSLSANMVHWHLHLCEA